MAKVDQGTQTFTLPELKNGIVREAAVDEFIVPKDSVELAINMHFDRIGAVMRRPGVTKLGDTISSGNPVLGMGVFRNNAGTVHAALAKVDTVVYANTGSGWTSVRTGLTASTKARFTTFADYVYMVNGNNTNNNGAALGTWSGSGSFGTTNDGDLPDGDFIENYRSRIWVADNSVDKVYYSDVVATNNAITGGTSFIQISPNDGEKITALKRHSRALLVFKQNHIYRIFSISSTDPDPAIFRGTYSQESVVESKDGIYYHHPTGFYKFVFDGEQEEISRPIIDVVKAIPRSKFEDIVGWSDEDHVAWEIGDITLDGISFTNLVCRRTISTQVWTIYSYPFEVRSAALYDNGSDLFNLLGGSDGSVYKYDVGNGDNGSDIFFDLITHWMYLTEDRSLQKTLTKIKAYTENAVGVNVSFQLDGDSQQKTNNAWRPIRGIQKNLADTLSLNASNFTRIRFRFSGSSKGTPEIFRGMEGLDITTAQPE